MAPGARTKFGAHIFEPEVFRKQCTALKNVRVTLLGRYGAPRNHSAPPQHFSDLRVIYRPGNCAPIAPSLRHCGLKHNAACKKLQTYTLANNLPLCGNNALNVLD